MDRYPGWAIGPFIKERDNPVLVPGEKGFDSWAAYNPAVIYAFGEYHMFYRAETLDERDTPYCGTSRIGLATSPDGRHFVKQGMILDADRPYELPGGLEDPRIAIVGDEYHLLYTAYRFPDVVLCSAVSRDLRHWVKLGPLLKSWTDAGKQSKSACPVVDPQLRAVQINGKYHLFTNEVYATSPDFTHWQCEPFEASAFSGRLHEVCTAITDYQTPGKDNVVLFIAGTLDKLCPERRLFYAVTQCLLERDNLKNRLAALDFPVIAAEHPYEKSLARLSGEADRGTIFLDCVFRHEGLWHAYYGASDSCVGAAFAKERIQ